MDNNDFLSQFSNEGKPDSFKQEERTPVVKEKKPINKKLLIFNICASRTGGLLMSTRFSAA